MTPTGRGWVLALFALVAAAAGLVFGIEELFPVAGAATVLLVLAGSWVASHREQLDSSRRLRPAYVAAGEAAEVELTLTNRAARRSPLVAASDPLEDGVSSASFRVAALEPGAAVTASYRLLPVPRGRYLIGPLELKLTDPFELVQRSRKGAAPSALTVHPFIVPLRQAPATSKSIDVGAEGQPTVGAAGDEFASLRPYLQGDDLRLVHWPSTARLDQVMVRQAEGRAEPHCTVAIDLREGLWSSSLLEKALAAAGGVLEAARRDGTAIRLLVVPAEPAAVLDTGFGTSGAHWGRVLDGLADAQLRPVEAAGDAITLNGALAEAGRAAHAGAVDTLTVITSSEATREDLVGLGGLAAASSLIVVIFSRRGASRPAPAIPLGRTVWVPEERDFGDTWSAAMAARVQPAEP